METTKTDETPRESGRQRLLRVGVEAFGTSPYDQVSISDVAARAGVAEGLPFHHFGSKRGFYIEVMRELGERRREIEGPRGDLPPAAALRDLLARQIAWVEEHPYVLFPMRGAPGTDAEAAAIIDQARHAGAEELLTLIGVSRPRPALRLAARGWIGLRDDTLIVWLTDDRGVSREQLVELLVASLVAAVEAAANADRRVSVDASVLLPQRQGAAPRRPPLPAARGHARGSSGRRASAS